MVVKTKAYTSLLIGNPYSDYGGVYANRYGNLVHIHIGAANLPTSALVNILTLDDDYASDTQVTSVGYGVGFNAITKVAINNNKVFYYSDDGQGYCCADLIFIKNSTLVLKHLLIYRVVGITDTC